MKPIIVFLVLSGIIVISCENIVDKKHKQQAIEELIGQKIDILIKSHGSPDLVEPSSVYSRKFKGSTDAVVFSYKDKGELVYVSKNCIVIGVFPIRQ